MAQGFAGLHKDVQHQAAVPVLDLGAEVADLAGRSVEAGAVARHAGAKQPPVGLDEGRVEAPGGAEVEQHQPAAGRVVQIIGEVGVGLDMPERKDLIEQQLEQQVRHPVALGLGRGLQGVEALPFDPRHDQNVRRAEPSTTSGSVKSGCPASRLR
jgi:hypothetical protein